MRREHEYCMCVLQVTRPVRAITLIYLNIQSEIITTFQSSFIASLAAYKIVCKYVNGLSLKATQEKG